MPNQTATHTPTIVYVEDNPHDVVLLREALQERGYVVHLHVIVNGAKALEYFQAKDAATEIPPPPHCILLDSRLPVVSGVELLAFVRGTETFKDTPVYIFGAEVEYRTLLQTLPLSPESFITKAHTFDGFLQLAELLMRSSLAKLDNVPTNPTDSLPEAPAQGDLRRHTPSGRLPLAHP